jgi:hypothetical protein
LLCTGIISQGLLADSIDVGQVLTINDLPDDDLLTIFDFYVVGYQDLELYEIMSSYEDTTMKIRSWQSLIHVCQRWRGLVFGSPRRLKLQLCCTTRTPIRETLDVWPALPLLIHGYVDETTVNNVIAEFEHSDHICQISLDCHATSQIETLWTAMHVPFPELAVLSLRGRSYGGSPYVPVLPDSFLGGSAPRLRSFYMDAIPFPGLPNLLLSATHLVGLRLYNIPHLGYFSPEAMVTCLSVLTSLEFLQLGFESPQSCPDQESRLPPPPTRFVLPTLKKLLFKGVNEYLEELVARIDTPRLDQLLITFFNDIDFDTPELIQFITLTFGALKDLHLIFDSLAAWVALQQPASLRADVRVGVSCRVPDWQLSSLAQICTSSLPLLSTTENLYIHERLQSQPDWKDGMENTEWLELLLPLMAVKDLYLSKQFAPRIAPALQEVAGARRTEVLPMLQNIFLEGFEASEPVDEGIGQFISARQLTNRPVTISIWERDLEKELSLGIIW